jgi:hypothetical protein
MSMCSNHILHHYQTRLRQMSPTSIHWTTPRAIVRHRMTKHRLARSTCIATSRTRTTACVFASHYLVTARTKIVILLLRLTIARTNATSWSGRSLTIFRVAANAPVRRASQHRLIVTQYALSIQSVVALAVHSTMKRSSVSAKLVSGWPVASALVS